MKNNQFSLEERKQKKRKPVKSLDCVSKENKLFKTFFVEQVQGGPKGENKKFLRVEKIFMIRKRICSKYLTNAVQSSRKIPSTSNFFLLSLPPQTHKHTDTQILFNLQIRV